EVVQGIARVMSRLPGATWERLARSIGDGPARGLERFAGAALELLTGTRQRFETNLSEYLQYELRGVASVVELEEFLDDVDRLRSDVDRLAKRIDILKRSAG